ncbi:MAG: SGNH/GDSL hydrolase family protein [Candidatus Thiodiazotropha taylori]|uniref:SGNH/GDSL hydrolase family protein n=1 Tax=Candidatus Thiodiazotropha taylori TaxID=2792791 RepID=A0A9E4KBL5_9GAMM|nr:SGNH/GDSL hydrolase family protein [Candidatus Thiodiazotropha taylori]MCW4255989.1 SGNH/GDSL hydrolase family protein [Candidatus Thiodiazotropha taylori]
MTTQLTFKAKFWDDNGDPLSGGKVYFYEPGTTNPKDTYSDSGTTVNPNPVILDSRGEAHIWGDGLYDAAIFDSDDNPIRTEYNIGLDSISITGGGSTAVKIACLGASDSEFGWNETWVNHLDKAFRTQSIDVDVFQTGAGAISFYRAMNDTDTLTGKTWAAITSEYDPDVIIITLGINDTILDIDDRTQSQVVVDAQNLFAYFKTNNPNAILIYGRLLPYDDEQHSSKAVTAIKKKYCVPYIQGTSTITGDETFYTSEPTELEKIITSTMQSRLGDWRILDAAIQAEADYTVDMKYFKAARLGWISHDRLHPTSLGHYFLASNLWNAFQDNSGLRDAVPILKEIRDVGDFTNFDLVWESATIPDSVGDGYDFDASFLDGNEYMMQANIYDNVNLIQSFRYWCNIQRPSIDVTNTVNKSTDDIFLVSMSDLLPDTEIKTKLWAQSGSEPSSWNSASPIALTSDTGEHISAEQNTSRSNDDYYIKYLVKNDVFGPYAFTVSGTFPGGAGGVTAAKFSRSTDIGIPTNVWYNIPLNATEFNDDATNITFNATTGQVSVAYGAGYTRFRVAGWITINSGGNGLYAVAFERNGVDQPAPTIGNMVVDSTVGAANPLMSFISPWLVIDSGGESLFLEVYASNSATALGAYEMGLQVEVM